MKNLSQITEIELESGVAILSILQFWVLEGSDNNEKNRIYARFYSRFAQ